MDWLETAASIAVGWTALSVAFVVAWSRFMGHVARKEHDLTRVAISASPASPQAYPTAA
jgi:hypothetical protein